MNQVTSNLSIREIRESDISLIADYWLKSDLEFLKSLGVDLKKLPEREGLTTMLKKQIALPYSEKQSLALIWENDKKPIGHCNVNGINFGKEATMHLHLWNVENRKKGIGVCLLKQSIPFFFEKLNLETLWCEPYAHNPAPNKTLMKAGFEFVKRYVTIPGSLNFEQEVNRYRFLMRSGDEN
ncbi:GNAT family N-acetyltransferase [Cryomorpha ignava]|uniref:GNAT family N-acetyltransferase n=1 Tax=Cryomorpha ignava TaxID=101383 RepID=A0A7K3WNV2_9FLAO|nr:GNAT family protein [Cryomorpha ignava]NEN22542.1 GNAT family N-acetyltransferase [Cryomorpha ignava]